MSGREHRLVAGAAAAACGARAASAQAWAAQRRPQYLHARAAPEQRLPADPRHGAVLGDHPPSLWLADKLHCGTDVPVTSHHHYGRKRSLAFPATPCKIHTVHIIMACLTGKRPWQVMILFGALIFHAETADIKPDVPSQRSGLQSSGAPGDRPERVLPSSPGGDPQAAEVGRNDEQIRLCCPCSLCFFVFAAIVLTEHEGLDRWIQRARMRVRPWSHKTPGECPCRPARTHSRRFSSPCLILFGLC